jgi:demethylmenaquinone methyltransferase/2-methoxy-6-polyprenyl-1,4-benzoquinol methylase
MWVVTEPDRRPPDEAEIRRMFDGVAPRYDTLNDVLSLGLDRWWRRRTAGAAHAERGDRVLDLGCGTGKLGALLTPRAFVVGVDVSPAMLARARRAGDLALVRATAFRLPFADAAFRAVVSGFVLRNLRDLPGAFAELARVVEPGGRIALVDATEPPNRAFRRVFDAYFGAAAPALGALVGRRDAYRYLARSLGQIPPVPEVCRMLRVAGFDRCAGRPLSGGMVTLFTGTRSDH